MLPSHPSAAQFLLKKRLSRSAVVEPPGSFDSVSFPLTPCPPATCFFFSLEGSEKIRRPSSFGPEAVDATMAFETENVPTPSSDPHASSFSSDATLAGELAVRGELPTTGSEVVRRGAALLDTPGRKCRLAVEALELRREEVVVQFERFELVETERTRGVGRAVVGWGGPVGGKGMASEGRGMGRGRDGDAGEVGDEVLAVDMARGGFDNRMDGE